jgi:hypothetical protein
VSWYFALCSVAFLVGATLLLIRRLRLSVGGARTTGEVVDYSTRMRSTPGERPSHMPHVRFVGADLREHTFISRMGASPERWPVGTCLPVVFLESDPKRAEIATPARLWVAPAAMYLLAAGAAFAAYGAA